MGQEKMDPLAGVDEDHSAGLANKTVRGSDEPQLPDDDPSWHHSLPESPGIGDILLYPFRSSRAWLRLLSDNFGAHFVAMNVFGEHFLKGVLLAGGSGGLVYAGGCSFLTQNKIRFLPLSLSLAPSLSLASSPFLLL